MVHFIYVIHLCKQVCHQALKPKLKAALCSNLSKNYTLQCILATCPSHDIIENNNLIVIALQDKTKCGYCAVSLC